MVFIKNNLKCSTKTPNVHGQSYRLKRTFNITSISVPLNRCSFCRAHLIHKSGVSLTERSRGTGSSRPEADRFPQSNLWSVPGIAVRFNLQDKRDCSINMFSSQLLIWKDKVFRTPLLCHSLAFFSQHLELLHYCARVPAGLCLFVLQLASFFVLPLATSALCSQHRKKLK